MMVTMVERLFGGNIDFATVSFVLRRELRGSYEYFALFVSCTLRLWITIELVFAGHVGRTRRCAIFSRIYLRKTYLGSWNRT